MDEEEETISKIFSAHLILDWRSGRMRIMMKEPKKTHPFEIPINIKMKVNIPKIKKIVAEGEIDAPTYKVKEMLIHTL